MKLLLMSGADPTKVVFVCSARSVARSHHEQQTNARQLSSKKTPVEWAREEAARDAHEDELAQQAEVVRC